MKKIKQAILLLAVIFMAAACQKKGDADQNASTAGQSFEIQILATSDLHGKMLPYDYALDAESKSGSLAQIASIIKEYRTDNTIIIDNGDTIQGNSAELFLNDEVHPMVQGMNAIGYDVWVAGNHEFNYGVDVLKKIVAQSKAQFLCGNVDNPDDSDLGKHHTIIEKNGVKIGIIGIVTPHITRWDAKHLEGYDVTDPVAEAKKSIAELKGKVDIIVAAAHMGENNEYDVPNSGVYDLSTACPEIDIIISGHDHKAIDDLVHNDNFIIQNSDSGKTITQILITVEPKAEDGYKIANVKAENISAADYEADSELVTLLADADARAKKDAQSVIGKLTGGPLVAADEINGIPRARLEETALINLINEVQMHYTGADVSGSALFIDNANLQNGDIRKCDVSLIYKYTNTLYKMEMTGYQLKKWMEWTAKYYNTFKPGDLTISFNPDMRGYNYDMFSGVKYDVNISKEPGNRIENLTRMDGTPVTDTDVFVVALNNYRASSQLLTYGEVFQEGEELPKLLEIDVRGDLGGVREIIADYIKNVKGGVLTAPALTGNWKITGYEWNEELHKKAVEQINNGTLQLKNSESGREVNAVSITESDLK